MFRWMAPICGGLLVALVLADVFLTVLYARSGAGVFGPRLASATWRMFYLLSKAFPRARDQILSFGGPLILVLMGCAWIGGVLLGFGLIIWPALGSTVVSTQHDAPHDLVTAIYISGYYMTTIGNGDFRPLSGFFKLLLIFESIVGMSLITLMLTYFVEIYNALQARSTFALKLHKGTAATGDAAELLARIGGDGNFDGARGALTVVADELLEVYESYHFYEALIYFRFREAHYALPRASLVVMDLVSLLRTALDDEKYAYLKRSAPAAQMWHGGMHALTEFSRVFLPPIGEPARGHPPDAPTAKRWRRRFGAPVARLRAEGIETVADERAGADAYVELRSNWDAPVAGFAAYLSFLIEEIDPAGSKEKGSDAETNHKPASRET